MAASLEPGFVESTSLYSSSALAGSAFASLCASAIRLLVSGAAMAAVCALEEKARESSPMSSYTTNPPPPRPSERSLIKGAQHKRMQSLQTSGLRDLRSYLDTHRSPERPERPERPLSGSRDVNKDYFGGEIRSSRADTLGHDMFKHDMIKDIPPLRPSSRSPPKSMLGENAHPSATMMALQNMTIPQHMLDPPPLSNITNTPPVASTPPKTPQPPPPTSESSDAIANQLQSITAIVSSLQKDMSQLSRRSKDNAMDLHGLKEATNQRDEDIRKSLKDLVSSMSHGHRSGTPNEFSRSGSSFSAKDPFMTPTKPFAMPQRTGSPNFMLEDLMGSPNPYSVEGAASVAMLEKIIREMVTKDGQERLVTALEKIVDRATGETAKKVAEMVEFVKQSSANKTHDAPFEPPQGSGQLMRSTSEGNPFQKLSDDNKAAGFVSEEMLKFLRKIKDSVAESGGVLMGNKTLIEDLRGEVLAMGRELARQIEDVVDERADSGQPNEEVGRIIQDGLADLKEHMDQVMRGRRRQSISSNATRNTVDSNEVYDVVKHALAERGLDKYSPETSSLDKEAIVSAIREAYEQYQPDFTIETVGLKPEEILDCLREGLQDFQPSKSLSRDEIEDAIRESLQHIQLPQPINEAHEIRDEVLIAVRECLEDLKPSLVSQQSSSGGLSREIILEAMREALADHQSESQTLEIPPEALSDAMRAGLESSRALTLPNDDSSIHHLQSLVEHMHSDFKASSSTGQDTEQVLNALHHGLEDLRAQVESYVDKTQDVAQKDEIVEDIRAELEQLRVDVQGYVTEGSQENIVSFMKGEFEHLLEEIAKQRVPTGDDKEEIIQALNAGFDGMNSQVVPRGLDLDSNEDINNAMKEEFEQLKDVLLGDTASHKGDLIEKLQAGFDGMHALVGEHAAVSRDSNEDVLAALRDEFEHLRETLAGGLIRSGGVADKDDIIDAVRELVDGLHSAQENAAKNNMEAFQQDLDDLKESLGNTLVRAEDPSEKMEILEALKAGLDDIKASTASANMSEDLLDAFRGEFRLSTAQVQQRTHDESLDIIDAVRLNVDDLRSHLEKKLNNPDRQMFATNEILDALNDGLDGLRSDVDKAVSKPVDVSYEILDTLKDGLAELREDIGRLKNSSETDDSEDAHAPTGNEIVLADGPEQAQADATSRGIVPDSLRRDDVEKLESMLSQLQVKVEAMDANIQKPVPTEPTAAPGVAMKDDLTGIEELLKDVQAAVMVLHDREQQPTSTAALASRGDTDAIETLLGNMKAKIEELGLSDPATAVTKENFEDVELVVRSTFEAIEALSKKIDEEGASKADVTVVQVIADDIKIALDEMKARSDEEAESQATKADMDALSLLVDDMKSRLDELNMPDPEQLPTRTDVEQLTGFLTEFREKYEDDVGVTAKVFDDRRQEANGLASNLTEVKSTLEEIKEQIKISLAEGGPIEGLKDSFKNLEDNINTNFNVTDDVKELVETVGREFERAHGSIADLQVKHTETATEAKDAIIAGFGEKLDERFDILMAKYDDAQLLADEQAKVMKEKSEEQEKILDGTKTMADELRVTIDTLGTSITTMNDRFDEATQKWSTDSETVFGKIDEAMTKFEDQKLEDKTEHSHTRDELKNIESIFIGFQDNVTEYHPKFMVALREIEALVKAHYDHAQQAKEDAEEHARALNEDAKTRSEELQKYFSSLPALLPAPPPAIEMPEKYDDAQVQEKLDKLLVDVPAIEIPEKYDDAQVHEKLDKILVQTDDTENASKHLERLDDIQAQIIAIEMPEKYDDAQTQEKLDKLLVQTDDTEKASTQLERLDEIHAQVKAIVIPEKYDDAEVREKLDKLLVDVPAIEMPKYDDAQVQEKLDKLLVHIDDAEKASDQIERLDEIRAQVKATAVEVSDFVAKQTQLITDGNEAKEREAEELALLVERRSTQKEQLETDIDGLKAEKERIMQELREEKERAMAELREEKDRNVKELKEEKESLLSIVAALQAERENLADQKIRLTGQVSSLHTALDIRREELHMMDAKADALERRIINGMMDHSRALMIAKGGKKSPTKPKKRMSVDPSADTPSAAANGISMALKPRAAIRRNGLPNPGDRRIHSLSQISGNAPTGAPAYTAPNVSASNTGLKRSQSVRTNKLQKASWGGRPSTVGANKENDDAREQAPLGDTHIIEEDHDENASETGTERRHSLGTESWEGPVADGRSEYGGTESVYSGSSYFTNSEADRRTSFGSNHRSAADGDTETINEHSEDDASDYSEHSDNDEPTTTVPIDDTAPPSEADGDEVSTLSAGDVPVHTDSEINRAVDEVVAEEIDKARFAPDSGVGTDLGTAPIGNEGNAGGELVDADYFRRAAEEEESTVG
ncbi:hypothetical protein P280DRAFT_498874 [Massarina eburnea CBS 473.64]|uniref:Transport protein USO1 n=1 Tax=Massarina eburnea CBS 473.64 TaxID=1395130 RepID=A0A6A6S0Y2_9PLEO|nr:hypothetical protein P280DRAFT_498874 [Massarina eburnea CBS 473.64]